MAGVLPLLLFLLLNLGMITLLLDSGYVSAEATREAFTAMQDYLRRNPASAPPRALAAETLPFQLVIWGSNFEKKPFNSSAFKNAQLDKVVSQLTGPLPETEQKKLWKQYQQILANEQPRTFLYYYSELEGFNERVRNVKLSLLATLWNMYEWKVEKTN